jgi:hypothetical protein
MTDVQTFFRVASRLLLPGAGFRHVFLFDERMDGEALREICPSPEFVGIGFYDSRRWIINQSGEASILPRRGRRVYGVIWRVHEVEMAALDMFYGVPQRFERYGSLATFVDGRRSTSEFYSARDRNPGAAAPGYLRRIIEIGRELGFPDQYLKELNTWTSAQDISIAGALRPGAG